VKKKKNFFVAHSLGTGVVCKVISNNEEIANSIEKLILVGTLSAIKATSFALYLPGFVLEYLRPFAKEQFRKTAWSPNADKELMAREEEISSKNPMWMIKAIVRQQNWPVKEEFEKIKISTLIIAGELDKITPSEDAKTVSTWIPNSKFHIEKDVAHFPFLENSENFIKLVSEFLEFKI